MPVYLCLPCQTMSENPGSCRKCGENLTEYISISDAIKVSASLSGKIGGIRTSDKKSTSSAANGLKGGRPKNLNGGRPKKTQD